MFYSLTLEYSFSLEIHIHDTALVNLNLHVEHDALYYVHSQLYAVWGTWYAQQPMDVNPLTDKFIKFNFHPIAVKVHWS